MIKPIILAARKKFFLLEVIVGIYKIISTGASVSRLWSVLCYSTHYCLTYFRLRLFVEPFTGLRQWAINTGWHQKIWSAQYDYFPTSPPVNGAVAYNSFYDKFHAARKTTIQQFDDSYLWLDSGHGIVFSASKASWRSFHEPWYKGSSTIIAGYFKTITGFFIDTRYQPEVVQHKVYVISHWYNYYHWITETLYRLTYIYNLERDITIVLPASLQQVKYVQDTLAAYAGVKVIYVNEKQPFLKVSKLGMVSCKGDCEDYDPIILDQIKAQVLSAHKTTGAEQQKYIYISRKLGPTRRTANEDEVMELLAGYGFSLILLEEMTFTEQVEAVMNAEIIIAAHGAGLTNMLFCKPGTRILELHRKLVKPNDMHSKVYWKMACSLKMEYYFQPCEPLRADDSFYNADLKVDLKELAENVNRMLKE